LERRGHRFVRYADDCNIYVGSERAGQRVMESVTRFITNRLNGKLKNFTDQFRGRSKLNRGCAARLNWEARSHNGFSWRAEPPQGGPAARQVRRGWKPRGFFKARRGRKAAAREEEIARGKAQKDRFGRRREL
jgi:hypothetical protein